MLVYRIIILTLLTLASTPLHAVQSAEDTGVALQIDHPWARSTTMGMHAGAAYITIENTTSQMDKLLKAESDIAENITLHTTIIENDIARMRHIGALEIPASASIEMKPGGIHIMLMGLKKALVKGETFPLTLVFEKAGKLTVSVSIQ